MGDIEVDKNILTTQGPFGIKGLKYLIGQEKDYEKVMCLFIMIPKMSAYRKDFDENPTHPTSGLCMSTKEAMLSA